MYLTSRFLAMRVSALEKKITHIERSQLLSWLTDASNLYAKELL